MEDRRMAKLGIKELAAILADKRSLDMADATHFVEALFDVLSTGLHYEKVVKIKGLGTFKVIAVSARKSVDVNTGEAIELSGRDKITFTPDATLRDLVNRPFAQFETVVVNDGVDFSAIDAKMEEDIEPQAEAASPVEPMAPRSVAEPSGVAPSSPEPITEPTAAAESLVEEPQVSAPEPVQKEAVTADVSVASEAIENNSEPATEKPEPVEPMTEQAPAVQEPAAVEPEPTAPTPAKAEAPKEQAAVLEEPAAPRQEQPAEPTPKAVAEPATAASWQDRMMESQTKTLTETNELLREQLERSQRLMRILGIVLIVFALLCCGGGYYMFTQFTQRDNRIEHLETQILQAKQARAVKPKPAPRAASDAIIPAIPDEKPAAAASAVQTTEAAPATAKANVKATAAPQAETKKSEPAVLTQYESDPRVRTGAYNIIGVKTTVRVKPGQTLASISRLHLGPGMECYVEAMNGATEVKPGQMVKIPELRLKRR